METSPKVNIKEIQEVNIFNKEGKKERIKIGEKVDIMSVELKVSLKLSTDEHSAKSGVDFLLDYIGEGPFVIEWMGIWSCGRVMVYLSGGKGVHLSTLVKA